MTKINRITATILVLFSTWVQAKVDIYFSPKGGVRERIHEELNRSHDTLDIAMYSFSDPSLVQKIKSLASTGVAVRLLLNQANRSAAKSTELEQAGVDVRYVNLVMHHKFAIVDAKLLMTGSQNWSVSAENSYDEDFLVFENEEASLQNFHREFALMWNKARDFQGPGSLGSEILEVEPPSANVIFTSSNFEAIPFRGAWSFRPKVPLSEGVAGKAIIAAIDSASESIQIATAHFRRRDFYEPLRRAMARGVRIELILDAQEYDGAPPSDLAVDETKFVDEFLAKEGATVKYKMYSRYWNHKTAKQMHSKYMIVDNRKVLTGSFNWSENAELATFENLITLGLRESKSYSKNFEKIMSYGEGTFQQLLSRIRDSKGQGPCVFDPITLSSSQIESLRGSYVRGACRDGTL